jgi:hypothetical protein
MASRPVSGYFELLRQRSPLHPRSSLHDPVAEVLQGTRAGNCGDDQTRQQADSCPQEQQQQQQQQQVQVSPNLAKSRLHHTSASCGSSNRPVPDYFDLLAQNSARAEPKDIAPQCHQVRAFQGEAKSSDEKDHGDQRLQQEKPYDANKSSHSRSVPNVCTQQHGQAILESLRATCPSCNEGLVADRHKHVEGSGVRATIVALPQAFQVAHRTKFCPSCGPHIKFWHGYYETSECYETSEGSKRNKWRKHLDADFLPRTVWMINKSFGIDATWARKWRLSLYCHRASFTGECAIVRALQPETVPGELDRMLLSAWVRWQVWQRANAATAEVRHEVADQVLELEIEELLQKIIPWYAPMMKDLRLLAWRNSGDRLDILCIDGNAKLYRLTCGAPCAETIWVKSVGLHLIRGCPESPEQRGVLCSAHATLRSQAELTGQVAKHRMLQPLSDMPFFKLEVQLSGVRPFWQPACTISSAALQAYFAKHGGEVIEARKQKRAENRELRRRGTRFLSDWSSESAKTTCACKTHKESVAAVKTASRSAGFLLAVTESGLVAGLQEIITAETLSQRYSFLADMADAEPELKGTVHDDNCHVRVFARTHRREDNEMSKRLSSDDFFYVIDRPHSRGHVDPVCMKECFPDTEKNSAFLRDFPTPICESVNSDLSPLAHTVHHMQRWLCFFVTSECVQVHNELLEQRRKEKAERLERKRAREGATQRRKDAAASARADAISAESEEPSQLQASEVVEHGPTPCRLLTVQKISVDVTRFQILCSKDLMWRQVVRRITRKAETDEVIEDCDPRGMQRAWLNRLLPAGVNSIETTFYYTPLPTSGSQSQGTEVIAAKA